MEWASWAREDEPRHERRSEPFPCQPYLPLNWPPADQVGGRKEGGKRVAMSLDEGEDGLTREIVGESVVYS